MYSSVAFFGDSIPWQLLDAGNFPGAANKCHPGLTPDTKIVNGQEVLGLDYYFENDILVPALPHLVIMEGTNDPYPSAVPTVIGHAVQAKAAGINVLVCRIPPRAWAVNEFNDALLAACYSNNIVCLDLFGPMVLSNGAQNASLFDCDLTHPNSCGRAVEVGVIKPALDAALLPGISPSKLSAFIAGVICRQ